MSGTSQAQAEWVKVVLGVDVLALDASAPIPGSSKPSSKPSPKGFADRFRKSESGGGDAKGKTPPEPKRPADKDLADKLTQLETDIKAIEAKKFDVDRMRSDLKDLKTGAAAAEKETDDAKRTAALDASKKRADELIQHVGALAKSIKDVLGEAKGKPSAEKKSEVYEKALKTFYNLDIEVPAGMKNTHFDRVFDMMGTVPQGDVKQDKLKHLVYNKGDIGGVYYSDDYEDPDTKKVYKAGTIEMGDFGSAKKKEDYEINGKKVKANSFDVTTLHEIGHSVDTKHGIMDKNQTNNGCGAWKLENDSDVADAFLAELKKVKLPTPVDDAKLLAAVQTALNDGTATQSDIGDPEWKKIAPWLISHCIPMREQAQPYFNSKPVVIDGRVYTQSGTTWYSYASSARKATLVNNYQWRTPAEWFAEVYAITWLKKKKPPSAVPADVAKHCWQG